MWVVTLNIFSSFMMEPESSLCTLSGMCISTTYMYMYLHASTFFYSLSILSVCVLICMQWVLGAAVCGDIQSEVPHSGALRGTLLLRHLRSAFIST